MTEPDMRHPKIQALIGSNARKNIIIGLVEDLLADPGFVPSAMEMEYWDSMHDKIKEVCLDAHHYRSMYAPPKAS